VVAEVNDFVRAVARHYPRIPHEEIRCVLVHSRERHLAGNGRRAGSVRAEDPGGAGGRAAPRRPAGGGDV